MHAADAADADIFNAMIAMHATPPTLRSARAAIAAVALPADDGQAVTFPGASRIETTDNRDADPQRGFQHAGQFLAAIRAASSPGRTMDARLVPLAAAPATAGNESAGQDGGFLVPTAFSTEIFRTGLVEASLLPLCAGAETPGNAWREPTDTAAPWTDSGVKVRWQAELAQAEPSKPVIEASELKLKKLMSLVPLTDELLSDSPSAAGLVMAQISERISWRASLAILEGTGAGQPLGCMTGGGLVTVAPEAGQAAGSIVALNLFRMLGRLPPASQRRAVWVAHSDTLPLLMGLTIGDRPAFLPTANAYGPMTEAAPLGRMLGLPVLVTQAAQPLGSAGDLTLLDLQLYRALTKAGGIQTATSMHLYFDAAATAFRATFRLDGQPLVQRPIEPFRAGANTISPFVALGARG